MNTFIVGIAAVVLTAGSLGAQDTTARPDREAMRRRVEERFGALLKERLQLSDSQVVRLRQTNRRFEDQRRLLLQQERDVRMSLRDELLAEQRGGEGGGGRANQERIASLLERALRVQRERAELLESEHRELARFLTPVQRAKLLGMQEQLRRNVGEMRRRAPGTVPYAGPPRDRMREGRRPGRSMPRLRPPV